MTKVTNQFENPKPEINVQKLGKVFHQAHLLEQKSEECEKLGKDESVPTACRVKYMEQSIAFRDLAKEIYNICAPLNLPSHV